MKKLLNTLAVKAAALKARAIEKAVEEKGASEHTDKTVWIIIGLVLGALLLGILYTLFNTTIKDGISGAINSLFSYNGGTPVTPTV